ncbi:hypothetical protein [uncultured Oscillibacter sp.]|jgi:hypothetical protein|uniref:hypothetical protein n=1 Tax=uncultured Oscillibacter sp. TaxID=876091 RepID=UPI0025E3478A|nr:hypothetical protein [uncultured Oscillibacter sp.]
MRARPLALCGLLSALAAALLILGGVLPGMVFCAPILAMGVLLPVLEEWGPKAAGTSYAAVSILALLLAPDRETAFVYLFFGWYPILRPKIAALPSRPLRVLARLAVCSAAAVLLYGLALRLMGLTEEIAAWYVNALLLAAGNAVFLLTDATLARLTGVWHWKLKKHLYR